ncbi:kinase-like domain-containing protein [Phellopilus nigrolimitatus]|nr:kinase-like domain-containing protein [Phellopilus nigrolimitatus]
MSEPRTPTSPGPHASKSNKHTPQFPLDLQTHEAWWRDRSAFLELKEYRLRPRLRPGWTPSWYSNGKAVYECEDVLDNKERVLTDATRLSDGVQVAIKKVSSREARIAMMFSTSESFSDPMNHCVPIIDHLIDNSDNEQEYIVMPLLRSFDSPEFYSVTELLDFARQTLEGLVYIHRRGVAHRDLSDYNILMDGNAMYPHGFHPNPSWQFLLPDASDIADYKYRSDVPSVRYYFADFGISAIFEDPNEPHLVHGIDGLDRDVPELDGHLEFHDPFPVDVFTLGNQYRKSFLDKYTNAEFMRPLVDAMTREDPTKRLLAEEALIQFERIEGRVNGVSARWRLRPREERATWRLAREIYTVMREISYLTKKLLSKPYVLAATLVPFTATAIAVIQGPHRVMDRIRAVFLLRPGGNH